MATGVPARLGPHLLDAFVQETSPLATQEEILGVAGRLLVDAGFERARYYQLGTETVPELRRDNPTLYLTWQATRVGEPSLAHLIGYSIDADESTLWDQEDTGRLHPMVGIGALTTEAKRRRWLEELGLESRAWIDVGVYHHRELMGLLAVDKVATSLTPTPDEMLSLSLLGDLLGGALSATAPRLDAELQAVLRTFQEHRHPDDDALVIAASSLVQRVLSIASMSVFKYTWTRGLLTKIHHSTFEPSASTPPAEAFRVRDEGFLTPKAWNNEEYRNVLEFDRLVTGGRQLLSQSSYDWHKTEYGKVQTVMYGVVGTREPKFLFRLVNNARHPSLPFLAESEVFARFVSDFSPIVENAVAAGRAINVRRVEADQRQPPRQLSDLIAKHLAHEGVEVSGVVARRMLAKPFFVYAPRAREEDLREAIGESSEFDRLMAKKNRLVLLRPRRDSAMARLLPNDGGSRELGCLVFGSGKTEGVITFPVEGGVRRPGQDAEDHLKQVASMLGESLEYDWISRQGEGALNALRLVGHEMATPLAAMKQLSSRALRISERASQGHGETLAEISGLRGKLQHQTDSLDAAVRLGHMVGLQSDGRLVGMFGPRSLRELLLNSIYRVRREINGRALLVPPGGIEIGRPSGNSQATIVCDGALIENAFANLYRNAVKYSVEQDRLARVETSVRQLTAHGVAYVDVEITNIGIGIPPYHEELIFGAFARFASDVDDVARRGMGLGLFLAREIARAHGGDVSHVRDVAVKPRARARDRDAFRTTFRIRLKLGLPVGPYAHKVRGFDE